MNSRLGRWAAYLVVVVLFAAGLRLLPGLDRIAPLVESDYCYLLIAADRLYDGLGLTSLQPVAPLHAWEWRYDWGFLTQWPAGYPILITTIRWLTGGTSLEAARMVSILGVVSAIVGWFIFVRRLAFPGIPGLLLAVLAATTCLTPGMLVNPSTDLILIAALPFILLLICEAREREDDLDGSSKKTRNPMVCPAFLYATAGVCAGLLFWFRYAAIFVPCALTLALTWEWRRAFIQRRHLIVFVTTAAVPIAALVLLNALLSPAQSSTERFNLGSNIVWDFTFSAVARAWWMLSDLGYYAHKPWAHWVFALNPLLLAAGLLIPAMRKSTSAYFSRLEWKLTAAVLLSLLFMLIFAAGLFGTKFDYISLERYYLPARPLFLVLICAPLLIAPRRIVHWAICPILFAFAYWTLFHNFIPAYARWSQNRLSRTPSGAWSRIFEPHSSKVYEWVQAQSTGGDLLIFSNFHEYLALETGVPTLPVPPTSQVLDHWVERARELRGTADVRVVFLLHPDNLWRSYWLATPDEIREKFDLRPLDNIPPEVQPFAFIPKINSQNHLTWISWN